jgi:hypothetical protein
MTKLGLFLAGKSFADTTKDDFVKLVLEFENNDL